jgi:signal transduction histidine kinase/CheY-like chemotaxis protein
MDYELVDLIDIEELKKLTENWTKLINLPMGMFDNHGNVLLGYGWLPVCTEFHRVNPITAKRCRQSDLETFNQLKAGKDFCYLTCPNGLVDTGAAIIIEGKYLGGLGFGQFFLEPPDMEFFSRQADEFGFDKGKYLQAVVEVPILSLEHVEQISKIWRQLAKMIAETGLARLRLMELNRELERHRDHLEDLVKEKTADLAKAKEAAEAANLAKSVFLANMSHSGEHLLSLIDEILEISKIESRRVTLNKTGFNLHRLIETTKEMFQLLAEKKGLSFTVERGAGLPEHINTDEKKLHQILSNLLSNAIKYTETGSINLRISSYEEGAKGEQRTTDDGQQALLIEVTDTGIGIAPENLDKIFDPFSQLSADQHSSEGVGLGLALTRQYVKSMGGTIAVKSLPGKGTTFIVELPFEVATMPEFETRPPVRSVVGLEAGQPRYRILIAEDEADSRIMLRQILEQVGFQVREAENGQEAVALYESWNPHLIWMDIRMPVMDGLEATRKIRNLELGLRIEKGSKIRDQRSKIQNLNSKFERVPIIALTASVFEEDKEKVLARGCDDFMRKPFLVDEILDKIAKHLEVRYIYQDIQTAEEKPVTPVLAPADLAGLPTDLVQQINSAAKGAMSKQLIALLEQIPPNLRYVADALTELVSQYQFSKIIALTEKENKDD